MILSDLTILDRMVLPETDPQRILIEPFGLSQLQGASVDARLGDKLLYRGKRLSLQDRLEGQRASNHEISLGKGQTFLLPPHGACLASTFEYVVTPADCILRVEGRSSIGRQFVTVHQTAGWCDPGFKGNITLEIVNHDPVNSFLLEACMPICQLTYLQLDRVAERQYKGRYQGDLGPVEAR